MQKVSKQSLAMLALSILLAISIALTFTFAAASTTKTATGTITFNGEFGLIYDGLTNNDVNDIAFTITFSAGAPTIATSATSGGTLDGVALKMSSTSKTATVTAKIEFKNSAGVVSSGEDFTAISQYITIDNTSLGSFAAGKTVVADLGAFITVSQIANADDYAAIVDATDPIDEVVITFTATAA